MHDPEPRAELMESLRQRRRMAAARVQSLLRRLEEAESEFEAATRELALASSDVTSHVAQPASNRVA